MPESAIGDLPFFRLDHHCLTVTRVCFLPLARVVCREVGVIWGQDGTLFADRSSSLPPSWGWHTSEGCRGFAREGNGESQGETR